LTVEQALELAKTVTAGDRPQLVFETRVSMAATLEEISNGQARRRLEQLRGLLGRHGVQGTPLADGWSGLTLEAPSAWDPFRLPSKAYALSERVDAELTDFVQESEEQWRGTLRSTYTGCTPICALVKELEAFDVPSWRHADQISSFVFRNLPRKGWRTEQTRRITFLWNARGGWGITAIQ
jgi:hypothetical protein